MPSARRLLVPRALVAGLLGLLLASSPRPTRAADAAPGLPAPLKPDDVLVWARDHRAEIVAAQAKASAATQVPKVVSALPDPMVMASIDHLPFRLEGVNWSVIVQQDFPLGGVLGARGRGAEAEARASTADASRVALEVQYQALGAYLMWVELQRSAAVVDDQLAIAKQVLETTKIRLTVSGAAAADVLRAQTDLAKLEGERKAIDAELSSSKSMLNATLGRPLDAELPGPELTLPEAEPPATASLVKIAVEKRPELAAMKARVDVAQARIDEMNAMYKPMAFVRAGYAQTMTDGPGAMLMVGVSIPIWREKLSAGVSEATSMKSMADSDVAAMSKMIEGEVGAAREQVVAERVRLATTRDKVLPLAKQTLSLMITTYGAGQVPLVSVLDAARMVREARMDLVVAELKVAAAWARLGRAIGVVKIGVG
jgi:cobalt-zinc-cadmium efflux system outer membrane protein